MTEGKLCGCPEVPAGSPFTPQCTQHEGGAQVCTSAITERAACSGDLSNARCPPGLKAAWIWDEAKKRCYSWCPELQHCLKDASCASPWICGGTRDTSFCKQNDPTMLIPEANCTAALLPMIFCKEGEPQVSFQETCKLHCGK